MPYSMAGSLLIKCSLIAILVAGVYGNITLYSSSSKDKSVSYDYQADGAADSTPQTSSLDEEDGSGMQDSNDSLPAENEYDGKKMSPSTNDDKIEKEGENRPGVEKTVPSTYNDKIEKEGGDRPDVEKPLKKEQKLVFNDSQLKKAIEHIAGKTGWL